MIATLGAVRRSLCVERLWRHFLSGEVGTAQVRNRGTPIPCPYLWLLSYYCPSNSKRLAPTSSTAGVEIRRVKWASTARRATLISRLSLKLVVMELTKALSRPSTLVTSTFVRLGMTALLNSVAGINHQHVTSLPSVSSPVLIPLRSDSKVLCWGSNTYGQVSTEGIRQLAPSVISFPHMAVAVATGDYHSCALLDVSRGPLDTHTDPPPRSQIDTRETGCSEESTARRQRLHLAHDFSL